MKSFLVILLKVLWVLLSAWTVLVFFVGIAGEWATMHFGVRLICANAVFPTLAAAAWTLPKSWRHSEGGTVLITICGMLSMFAIVGGYGLAAVTDPSEAPVRFVASVALTAHAALHAALAVYAVKASEKRHHQEWRQTSGLA